MAGKPDHRIDGTWTQWGQDLALRGAIRVALVAPWAARLALFSRVIRWVVAPLAGYRARSLANLSHIWPDLTGDRAIQIARAVEDNAARTMIENYDPNGLLRRMADVAPTGDGVSALEEARRTGQPVLFVTGHFGNYEAPRAALVARGYTIGGLYRPMSNPYFNAHYAANMHALSEPVFEQGRRGTMGLIKHLRAGGMGVLLFDIYDSAGAPIDFMGKPAPTLTSAAEIALKTGALVIPFFGPRSADGVTLGAEFEAPIPHTDPLEMTKAMTARLEARITADPGQWFWIHRRWKPKRQMKRQRKRAAASTGP